MLPKIYTSTTLKNSKKLIGFGDKLLQRYIYIYIIKNTSQQKTAIHPKIFIASIY